MSFDALAPHYRWMEWLLAGEKLQHCRTAFLDKIPEPENILLPGEGHGRFLAECCRRFPKSQITYLDASKRMLQQARQRLKATTTSNSQVEFIHTDVLNWIPTQNSYNLIVTNFFLDCFQGEQLDQIVSKLASATTLNSNWLIADFQAAASGWKRVRSELILWAMYLFFSHGNTFAC